MAELLEPFEGEENWSPPREQSTEPLEPLPVPRIEYKRWRDPDRPDTRVLIRSEEGKHQVTARFTPDEWAVIEHAVLVSRGLLAPDERTK